MGNLWHKKNYYIFCSHFEFVWASVTSVYGLIPDLQSTLVLSPQNVRHEMSICFILCSTLSATNDFCTPLKIHNNCVIFVFGSGSDEREMQPSHFIAFDNCFPPFFSTVFVYRNTIDFIPTSISKRYTHCLSLIKVLRTSLSFVCFSICVWVLLFFGSKRALSKPIKLSFFSIVAWSYWTYLTNSQAICLR